MSKNVVTLKSTSEVTQVIGYGFLLVFYSNFVPKILLDFKNAVTLKTKLGYWKYHHSIERMQLPIDVL